MHFSVNAILIADMGKGITCECSFLVTDKDLGWSEVTEPTQLETLEDGLIGPVRKLGRKLVSSALINNDDKHSVPKEEEIGLHNMIEVRGEPTLNFRSMLGMLRLHASPTFPGDYEWSEL